MVLQFSNTRAFGSSLTSDKGWALGPVSAGSLVMGFAKLQKTPPKLRSAW